MTKLHSSLSHSRSALILALVLLVQLGGCATLKLQPPQLAVTGIKPAASSGGLSAAFEIQLNIVNPNGVALPIKGMSYQLALNGVQVLRGASGDIASIPAYGNANVSLPVTANLFAAPKLLLQLADQTANAVDYELSATIDFQGWLPSQHVVEKGRFSTSK